MPHSTTLQASVYVRAVYPFTPLHKGCVLTVAQCYGLAVCPQECCWCLCTRAKCRAALVYYGIFLSMCYWTISLCVAQLDVCLWPAFVQLGVCISAKSIAKISFSSCSFQDVGEMEPDRLSILRQAWQRCQCGSACFGIRKKGLFSPTLHRKRVHVSQAAFSSVVCSLRPWPSVRAALRSRGTSNEKTQPYFLNSSSF